jgi:hypothetical protein
MPDYKPHYIASFEQDSGLDTYYEPFLIPEKAFPALEDAFCFRGRVLRRMGNDLLGRLRRVISVPVALDTQASGVSYTNADILSDPSFDLRATEPNAEIEAGTLGITVGAITFTDNGDGTLTGSAAGNSGTINYVTGALALTFNPALGGATDVDVDFSYFPSLPCMGLPTRELNTVNSEQLVAFDTKYAYRFQGGAFEELPAATPTTWNGSDSDLFWTTNFAADSSGNDFFWATNFNKSGTPDPIRYYDGTDWTLFAPIINGTNELHQARILLGYKNRLLALNTWEGATLAGSVNFPQRVRFSKNGSPTDQTTGWLDDESGKGGFIDAPTDEHIIGAEFIKDVLIIKFERSSWKVIYTSNEILPFAFQKINTELGAESTFSLIPFDRGVFSVANVGITTDDSVNVFRIDLRIPNIVFRFNNDHEGVKRIYGKRDYGLQLAYWAYPSGDTDAPFPDRILVYNYVNSTYAIFNDCYTCFGYYQRSSDLTWATLPYPTWSAWTDAWSSGRTQSAYPNVVGGNQQGYVSILNQGTFNSETLSITDILPGTPVQLTVPNHNLQSNRFVKVTGIIGSGSQNPEDLNGAIYRITKVDANNINLQLYNPSTGQFDNVSLSPGGTYLGGGKLTLLNNINITTKRFAPFYEQGAQARVGYFDFLVEKTTNGEISVDLFVDENSSIPINDPSISSNVGLVGDNILLTRADPLIPFQEQQQKLWNRIFVSTICQNFQLQFFYDDAQMSSEDINSSNFILHALVMYLTPNARLVQ